VSGRPSAAGAAAGWRLEDGYGGLPSALFTRLSPTPVARPEMVVFNAPLARRLGLDPALLESAAGAALFAGNLLPEGANPLAQAYAGHQFGGFAMLGDGRAVLLGEQRAPDGALFDIQLKGSGPTPYSRMGDGRAALGPMLREYLVSEAMAALGIPTTRSLAVVSTGEAVLRDRALPGAVLVRVAASHLRVGTFQYAATLSDPDPLDALIGFALARHDPGLVEVDRPALYLLETVMERQAKLVAQWMGVGFIHGVMNSDNMTISGETIDYGPCAFMDVFHPATVFSSIDRQGRYAYANQPLIAHWNLVRLAEALLSRIDPDQGRAIEVANAAISRFPDLYEAEWLAVFRTKLGLATAAEGDRALIEDWLKAMADTGADFTLAFRALADGAPIPVDPGDAGAFAPFLAAWQGRLRAEGRGLEEARATMQAHNPALIARNHRVEEALRAAESGDLGPFTRLLAGLGRPFAPLPEDAPLLAAPLPHERVAATFCGT
jgi:uncharacterized protein YdiU (UPF0061 family)